MLPTASWLLTFDRADLLDLADPTLLDAFEHAETGRIELCGGESVWLFSARWLLGLLELGIVAWICGVEACFVDEGCVDFSPNFSPTWTARPSAFSGKYPPEIKTRMNIYSRRQLSFVLQKYYQISFSFFLGGFYYS